MNRKAYMAALARLHFESVREEMSRSSCLMTRSVPMHLNPRESGGPRLFYYASSRAEDTPATP